MFERAAQELPHQAGIAFEAAGRQHDATAGADVPTSAIGVEEPDPRHPAGLAYQLDRAHPQPRRDTVSEAAPQEAGDQPPAEPFQRPGLPFRHDVAGDHAGAAAERDLLEPEPSRLPGKRVPPPVERASADQLRLQRPATAGQSAGMLGVVVGIARHQLEPQRRVPLEAVHQAVDSVDERLHQPVVHDAVGQPAQVGQCRRAVVFDPGGTGVAVGGQPDDAAR